MKLRVLIKLITLFPLIFYPVRQCHAQDTLDVQKQKKVTVSAHPILGYTPETNLMFGLGGFIFIPNTSTYLYNPMKEVNLINPFFIYTLNNQIRFVTTGEFYINRNFVDLRFELSKFPEDYYGIGNFTSGDNEVFTQRSFRFTTSYMRRITYNLQAGIIFETGKVINDDIIESGMLQTDSTYLPVSSYNTGIGPAFKIDKRNNIYAPRDGFYLHTYYIYRPKIINDISFHRLYFDFRKYFVLFHYKRVLAVQLKTIFIFGETVPLYYFARLGGETRLRGILTNRYIDKKMAFAQVEYRQMFNSSIGFVVFGGTGRVSDNLSDFAPDHLKFSAGGGIRFVLLDNPAFRFRIDYGYGTDNQSGIYVGLYEVF